MPFGEARILIADIENNLRFPGQYYDRETGLHYNYHRYYDPDTGRYLTPDPIGLAGGMNLYVYVDGNPVNWSDPLGLTGLENTAGNIAQQVIKGTATAGTISIGSIGIMVGGLVLGTPIPAGEGADIIPPYLEAKKSGKEKANDVPSWAEGEKPLPGESGKEFAKRLLDKKYGKGNYPTGPGTEYNKIKKGGDRCP
jgi:RHS repeat-associated protein